MESSVIFVRLFCIIFLTTVSQQQDTSRPHIYPHNQMEGIIYHYIYYWHECYIYIVFNATQTSIFII